MDSLLGFFKYLVSLRWLKVFMPKSLYVRAILIIIIPTILALAVATFIFFDRHWQTTSRRMAQAVAGEISMIVDIMENQKLKGNDREYYDMLNQKLDIITDYKSNGKLSHRIHHYANPVSQIMQDALDERLGYPHLIESKAVPGYVRISVQAPSGLYVFSVSKRRTYIPLTDVFIGWMFGSSVLLSAISLLFMRNQVRPVRRLADAAEAIGKGHDVPWFKLEGATEVRQAASALIVMRDRIRRAMTQRTAMLAGVSHDLRTPLTRMKLQLAMMKQDQQTRGFKSDIEEMEAMLEAYLAFARGDEAEPSAVTDIGAFLQTLVEEAKHHNPNVTLTCEENICTNIRPQAFKRCLNNIIMNALRYGNRADISVRLRDRAMDIIVDDNGPGIPLDKREDVFRPFFRLDESRNLDTGGVGLGLSIARDIARSHGGNLVLEDSPTGGLRARVWIPV